MLKGMGGLLQILNVYHLKREIEAMSRCTIRIPYILEDEHGPFTLHYEKSGLIFTSTAHYKKNISKDITRRSARMNFDS